MSLVKYDNESLKIMSLFEKVTRTRLKDSFVDNNGLLTFIVNERELGRAVGKQAVNVKKLEKLLNRKIKILEFNSNIINFIKNLIYPLKAREIKQEGEEIIIKDSDIKIKGLLIGKNAKNLRNTESIVKKYFQINEIKVI